MNNYKYHEVEQRIGYTFNNPDILVTALTHTSYINERKINITESYERSEFLGDAILEYIVSEYLYHNKKDYTEGRLTKLRASLVCEFTLSQIARELGFGKYVLLSKGEELTGGRDRNSILCDLFEAVLGAIYLDGGLEPAKEFVYSYLLNDIDDKSLFYDSKTTLQELMQKEGRTLSYELIDEIGPDHNKKFISAVVIDDSIVSKGEGASRKAAEQMAAYNALLQFKKKQV